MTCATLLLGLLLHCNVDGIRSSSPFLSCLFIVIPFHVSTILSSLYKLAHIPLNEYIVFYFPLIIRKTNPLVGLHVYISHPAIYSNFHSITQMFQNSFFTIPFICSRSLCHAGSRYNSTIVVVTVMYS